MLVAHILGLKGISVPTDIRVDIDLLLMVKEMEFISGHPGFREGAILQIIRELRLVTTPGQEVKLVNLQTRLMGWTSMIQGQRVIICQKACIGHS